MLKAMTQYYSDKKGNQFYIDSMMNGYTTDPGPAAPGYKWVHGNMQNPQWEGAAPGVWKQMKIEIEDKKKVDEERSDGEEENTRSNLNNLIPSTGNEQQVSGIIDSPVTVPEVQDFQISRQMELQKQAESQERINNSSAFERMLQSIGNANQSPAYSFTGVAGNNRVDWMNWEDRLTGF
jgi:hypothetical protein